MALVFPTTQATQDTVGVREDLSELIMMISPTETPYMMMCSATTASNPIHEYQMDRLAAADPDNLYHEGFKVAAVETVDPTIRMQMPCQISAKYISVTGTVEVARKAGRSSSLSYQLAKRSKELKRDMEAALVGQTTTANMLSITAAGAPTVARRIGAVQSQFHSNWVVGGTLLEGDNISRSAAGGPTDGGYNTGSNLWIAPGDGTPRALLETDLQQVIQGAWTNGGDPSIVMCGPFNKRVISNFTGNSTRFDRGEDQRLVAAISVYVSDYGEHKIVPNRFMRERDVLVLTPELCAIAYYRSFRQHALAKTGDSEDRTLLVEWCPEHLNNAGNGIVADLTSA